MDNGAQPAGMSGTYSYPTYRPTAGHHRGSVSIFGTVVGSPTHRSQAVTLHCGLQTTPVARCLVQQVQAYSQGKASRTPLPIPLVLDKLPKESVDT